MTGSRSSTLKPVMESCYLYTGHRLPNKQVIDKLFLEP